MFDLMKKTMLAGIGLALKTKDEVVDLAGEFAKKTKMTETEGKKFIEELTDRYETSREKFEKKIEETVKKAIKKADIVTGEELKALKKEIRELRKAVSEDKTNSDA